MGISYHNGTIYHTGNGCGGVCGCGDVSAQEAKEASAAFMRGVEGA